MMPSSAVRCFRHRRGARLSTRLALRWLARGLSGSTGLARKWAYWPTHVSAFGRVFRLTLGGRPSRSQTRARGTATSGFIELADGRRSHLTFEEALEANPEWTADGSRIVFTSTRRGFRDIHWKDALGSGSQDPLLESDRDKTVHSVSSDGVVFVQDRNLWLLPLTGERKPRPLVVSEHRKLFGQMSPDGRWLLYQSEESGKDGRVGHLVPSARGEMEDF